MNNHIEYEHDRDSNWEITTDCNFPALLQISHINWLIFEKLTPIEQHELSKMNPRERREFVRKRTLDILAIKPKWWLKQ